MNLRSFVAVVCTGVALQSVHAAGGISGGISDIVTSNRSAVQKVRGGTSDRAAGGAGAVVDERPVKRAIECTAPTPGAEAVNQPAVVGCDFGGFPDRDQVAMSYAGGQSASGVVKTNFGIAFSGAVVLNAFNGAGAPNPGVVYTPGTGTGRIVASFTQFNALTVEFAYSSKVALQLCAYSSADATGTPLANYSIAPNLFGSGGFTAWSQYSQGLPAETRSVAITGTANYWGLDAFAASGQITSGAVAEYYQSSGCGGSLGTGWAGTLASIGQPAITLSSLSSLEGLRALFINNYDNCGAAPMVANAAVLRNFVNAGGVLVVHDRWGFPGSWVPGASAISSTGQVFGSNVDRGAAASSFVDGPYGSINDSDLDGGNHSTHGYMCSGLPSGTQIALTNGSCAVGIAYRFGAGWVYYSTIPLDFYQRGNGGPAASMNRYAKNLAVAMIARSAQPTLKLAANAASCNPIGSSVQVSATLENCGPVVAGQMLISWDPSKLDLASVSEGDAPFSTVYTLNQSAGMATILATTPPGSSPTVVLSKVVARLNFTVIGGACSGTGNEVEFFSMAPFTTSFTDGSGGSVNPALTGSTGFVVDDGAPVLSNVPADVSVQAFAGEGGSALVTLGTPTATDACAPSLVATGLRSDGQALDAAWPSGTTTVTWSATDPCGNTTTATTSVTVDPTNTLDLAVNVGYGYYGAPRTLSLAVLGSMGTQTRSASVSVMWDGSATFSATDLPVDTYDCVTIEDTARSLRARVSISDTGSVWSAAAANLVQGDVINDEVIDVLDWGAYIVQNPNADFNGDGLLNSLDGDVILANFGKRGDSACGAGSPERAAITAISVSDLVAMGMPELAGADLNGDGMLDTADMELAGN